MNESDEPSWRESIEEILRRDEIRDTIGSISIEDIFKVLFPIVSYKAREDVPEEVQATYLQTFQEMGMQEDAATFFLENVLKSLPTRAEYTRMQDALEYARGCLDQLADEEINGRYFLNTIHNGKLEITVDRPTIIDDTVKVAVDLVGQTIEEGNPPRIGYRMVYSQYDLHLSEKDGEWRVEGRPSKGAFEISSVQALATANAYDIMIDRALFRRAASEAALRTLSLSLGP